MKLIAELPNSKGSYALLMHLDQAIKCSVGCLGEQKFEKGDYAYTGSAFGPGGIRGRIQHHLRTNGSLHWHIDYLMPHTSLKGVLYTNASVPKECYWVTVFQEMAGASSVIRGFGSSDCRSKCLSHLIYFKNPVTTRMVWHHLSILDPNGDVILCDYLDPMI